MILVFDDREFEILKSAVEFARYTCESDVEWDKSIAALSERLKVINE